MHTEEGAVDAVANAAMKRMHSQQEQQHALKGRQT